MSVGWRSGVFDAVSELNPIETVWSQPINTMFHVAFVNKMDRAGADFQNCIDEIRENWVKSQCYSTANWC